MGGKKRVEGFLKRKYNSRLFSRKEKGRGKRKVEKKKGPISPTIFYLSKSGEIFGEKTCHPCINI